MKYFIVILLSSCMLALASSSKEPNCDPLSFTFGGKNWHFPSTVAEAVNKHRLDYKPPGYYYKTDSLGMEVILEYHNEPFDFNDEYQPKEVLFPRKLHTYLFRSEERPGIYDSLQHHIEQLYNKKFALVKGLKIGSDFREDEKYFECYFLKVNDCLTIGIEKSPQRQRKFRKVAVRYMYGLTQAQMGTSAGSYLNE